MADPVALPGSERPARAGATRVRDLDPDQRFDVTVTLTGPPLPEPGTGQPLTREQFEQTYGAKPGAIAHVTAALEGLGLTVTDSSPLTRSLHVSGTAAQFEAAFRPGLGIYSHPDEGEFRGRAGQLHVPAELEGHISGVFGLDERRVAHRRHYPGGLIQAQSATASALSPAQLASHYDFPAGDGAGQTVAIAEFGGGYFASDLQAFCARQGTSPPNVAAVGVNGAPVLTLEQIQQLPQQQRQQQLDDSVEVNMDVQIVAGLAPAADQIVYFSTFDEQGWVDLIGQVIAGKPSPAVTLSVSWGLAEDDPSWSAAARTAIDERLQAAAAIGITVCVAAGDDGSGDQENDGRAHVDFPASSPHALAVGGTMLSGGTDVVWWETPGYRTQTQGGGATGGGVSTIFPRPSWQHVHVPSVNAGSIDGRVIPDVAALAGPPFYDLVFEGRDQPNGGTSAATPLWAALIARLAGSAENPWKPQFLPPLLYAPGAAGTTVGAAGCTDVMTGNNIAETLGKGYSAAPGFDAVSGWGVPNGTALLQALRS